MHQSLCPQDCYTKDKVHFSSLVNFSPTSSGIESVKSDNLTCSCDPLSCSCLHQNYLFAEPEQKVSGICDDHCVLSLTILTSLVVFCVFLLATLCRKGYCQYPYKNSKTEELYMSK